MYRPRLHAHDAEGLAWLGSGPDRGRPLMFRLRAIGEAASRCIAVSAAVLIIHFAALKYIFLAT